jgi:hypothetical protein
MVPGIRLTLLSIKHKTRRQIDSIHRMEPYSRQELTRLAAEDIAVIIGKIEAESDWTKYLWNQTKFKNLMTLSTSLLALSFNQAKYEQGEQKDSYLAKQNMLLDALELMCTVCHTITFIWKKTID